MNEEWRPCFGGVYSVSSLGRVRRNVSRTRAKAGAIMRPIVVNGYEYVKLCDGERRQRVSVHGLVAAAFIGERPAGAEVNHRNAAKRDNRPSNLEYVSHAENVAHAVRMGLCQHGGARGERQGSAKLTETAVREIRAARDDGATLASLAARYNVSIRSIVCVAKRITWGHVA